MRAGSWARGRLFRKYFLYFLLLGVSALLVSEATEVYFTNQETRAALVALQQEKALGAALRIEQFATGHRAADRLDAAPPDRRGRPHRPALWGAAEAPAPGPRHHRGELAGRATGASRSRYHG